MFNLFGWNAISDDDLSDDDNNNNNDDMLKRHQQQYNEYVQNQLNKPPKKNKNSGGSSGIITQSKSTRIKSLLGVDVDDEFITGKINNKFRYIEPKTSTIQDPTRILIHDNDNDDDNNDDNTTRKSNLITTAASTTTTTKMTKSKNDKKRNRINAPNTNTTTTTTTTTTNNNNPKLKTKLTFDQITAQHQYYENEEDMILIEMTDILQRLNTNSNTINTQLQQQTILLDDTQQYITNQIEIISQLEIVMDNIIQRSNCNHYIIILIELIIIIVLFFIILM